MPVTVTPDGAVPSQLGGECSELDCSDSPLGLAFFCPPETLTRDAATGRPLVCVNPNRDAPTAYSAAVTALCPKAYSRSEHDTVPGNQTMSQCRHCTGLTVTFH